jgi:hypothetical protein
MSRIVVLNPEYEQAAVATGGRAPRLPVVEPAVLTLIENGKPKARDLLRYIADGVAERIPIAAIEIHSKPSAAAPIDADTATMLAARSRLVITGVGD